MSYIDITIRVFSSYFVLLLLTRLMGKKQLSQLTYFNYVTGITIGSITANLAVNSNLKVSNGIYSLILWTALTILLELLSLNSRSFRQIVDGQPTILIKNGSIIKKKLKWTRTNIDELTLLLRKSKVFDLKEVDYAILETNGELSVLKKSKYKNYTVKDSQEPFSENKNLSAQAIIDGKVIEHNLKELGFDANWLDSQIKKYGYQKHSEIFYAEIGSNGQLFIMPSI